MILNNEFVVKVPLDTLWNLLDEMETFVPCVPGAYHIARDGEEHQVGIRLKVGTITTNFQGTVRFVEKDRDNSTVRILGKGKDLGGKASATANVTTRLEPLPDGATRVAITTDLAMTGKLAQFGGGIIADVASRLTAQFARNLEAAITDRGAAAAVDDEPPVSAGSDQPETVSPRAAEAPALDVGQMMIPVALTFVRRHVAIPLVCFIAGLLVGSLFF